MKLGCNFSFNRKYCCVSYVILLDTNILKLGSLGRYIPEIESV